MTKPQTVAVLTELCARLRQNGSWCGETHLQKAAYFLQTVAGVPLNLPFTLYKFGPFSFELRDELAEMLADRLFEAHPRAPYGPMFEPTARALAIAKKFPTTLKRHANAISFVAEKLGSEPAASLEQLGTALFLTETEHVTDPEKLAHRLHDEKPHVSLGDARRAVHTLNAIVAAWHAPHHGTFSHTE